MFDLNKEFVCEVCGQNVKYMNAFCCAYCGRKMCDKHSCNPERPMAVCCQKECVRLAWSRESVSDENFEEFYKELMADREEYLKEQWAELIQKISEESNRIHKETKDQANFILVPLDSEFVQDLKNEGLISV